MNDMAPPSQGTPKPGPVSMTPGVDETVGSNALLALVTMSHGLNDLYTSFLAPLLPLLIPKFGLSLALAGLLQSALSLTSSVAQPIFGFMSDRSGRVAFIALGPALTALALSSLGLIPSYPLLFVALIVGGVSTAMFHPQAGSMIPQLAGSRSGRAMGLFIAGGTLGYSLGPILVALIVSRFGLGQTWMAALPAIVALPFLLRYAPKKLKQAGSRDGAATASLQLRQLTTNLRPLVLMWLVVVFRSTAFNSFVTFSPVMLETRGAAFITGGAVLTTFIAAGAAGTLLGGFLSDRVASRKGTIILLLSLAIPALLGAIHTQTWAFWVFVALSGGLLEATNPMMVVAAQEALPENRGVASGVMMGFGWGVGGLMVAPIGLLADTVGLPIALTVSSILLGLGVVAAFLIPSAIIEHR